MNTPKTVAAIDELVIKGISVAEQIYLSAKDDAQAIRQLETQVQELREALELVLPKVAHDYKCGKVRPAMHLAEHGSMSFDDCQCEIKAASAILEKTK